MFEYKMWWISPDKDAVQIEEELAWMDGLGWEVVSMFFDVPHNRYLVVTRKAK